MPEVQHFGSCHCGAVKWTFTGPEVLDGCRCNCTVCNKKQNHHCIIKLDRFKILEGEDKITTYRFNTGVAQHKFCSICGVQSFYHPRSNPDAVAIMPHCIDGDTLKGVNWTYFNGQEWEKTMEERAPAAQ